MAAIRRARGRAGSIVADAKPQGVVGEVQLNVDGRAWRVTPGVGECFLDDAAASSTPGSRVTGGPRRIRRAPAPDASRASSSNSLSCPRPGWGRRSAKSVGTSSRSTPSSRRISVSAARAVSPMAESLCDPAAGIPGVVSRALSACTATMEMWWATTSWSSRAMRARSPRAVCSISVWAMTSRAALFSIASFRTRAAIPVRAAAGASEASSTVRTPLSEPMGRAPTSASTRNGTASPTDSSAVTSRRELLRPSRYNTMSCAPRPATVRA